MKAARVLLLIPLALVLLFIGVYAGGHPENLPGPIRDSFLVQDDRGLHAELLDEIDDNYYKKVDHDKLEQQSLKGIVTGLHDRFSHYLSPKETKQFQESISGSFSGVGMTVEAVRRGLRIQQVFAKTPASRGRLHRGDLITRVDGRSIAGVSSGVATARIKGPPGTSVRLSVQASAKGHPRNVRLRRARIKIPVARGRIVRERGTPLGVVTLASFTNGAHNAVRAQVDKVRRRGAKGIVLDLRGNGGGLLGEAVLVASIFVDKGPVVSTRGRTKPERKLDAQGGAIPRGVPVVVLVDRGTASASEIVTGALKDHRRATVVGTRTFGKGVFQEVRPLSNGGELDITAGRYYLPSGRNISGKGIQPQVKANDKPRTRKDEALPKALDTLLEKAR
jgi:carboxyl-terminal processing protease